MRSTILLLDEKCANMAADVEHGSLSHYSQLRKTFGFCILFLVVSCTWICLQTPSQQLSVISMRYQYEDMLLDITKDLKKILFWTKQFDYNFDGAFLEGQDILVKYCKRPCVISRRREEPELYDALVFHTRNYHNPPSKRSPDQIYVAFSMESPINIGSTYIQGNFYNWSASMLSTSNIPVKYNTLLKKPATLRMENLPQFAARSHRPTTDTSASVLWIVSNCKTASKRELYVQELTKYIPVDIYGQCGRPGPELKEDNIYKELAQSGQYKFYLAFENSLCKDYISEKVFTALSVGLLPIVLGGLSSEDYLRPGLLPPNSFIDARRFRSPKALASYLELLDGNQHMYLSYHRWRRMYDIGRGNDWICGICNALHETNGTKHRSLNWLEFYDQRKLCDVKLVDHLIT